MRRSVLVLLLAIVAGCESTSSDFPLLDGGEIEQHMRTLSSDEFLGRGPGHPGGDMAAEYIGAQFASWGLDAPDGSHFQAVPMVGTTTDPTSASLSFRGPGGAVTPAYMDDFVLNAGDPVAEGAGGSAELVFVGYGINAPENEWDDFAGVDVAGKYIMILVNDPPAPAAEPDLFGGPAMTYYGRWTYKYE